MNKWILFWYHVPLLSVFSLLFYQHTPPLSLHSDPAYQGPGLMCSNHLKQRGCVGTISESGMSTNLCWTNNEWKRNLGPMGSRSKHWKSSTSLTSLHFPISPERQVSCRAPISQMRRLKSRGQSSPENLSPEDFHKLLPGPPILALTTPQLAGRLGCSGSTPAWPGPQRGTHLWV